jgi:hypothetical protein
MEGRKRKAGNEGKEGWKEGKKRTASTGSDSHCGRRPGCLQNSGDNFSTKCRNSRDNFSTNNINTLGTLVYRNIKNSRENASKKYRNSHNFSTKCVLILCSTVQHAARSTIHRTSQVASSSTLVA